jgi:DNA gyrase subunit A
MKTSGQITRSKVTEVPVKGRDTMGVKFVLVKGDDSVAAIARYPESGEDEAVEDDAESPTDIESVVEIDSAEAADEASPETPEDTDTE